MFGFIMSDIICLNAKKKAELNIRKQKKRGLPPSLFSFSLRLMKLDANMVSSSSNFSGVCLD
jgi:beta-lactamase class D